MSVKFSNKTGGAYADMKAVIQSERKNWDNSEQKSDPVSLLISTCGDCPFVDHSGAFTPGGARDICSHKKAVDSFAAGVEGMEESRGQQIPSRYHWRYRVVDRSTAPPEKCPIREEVA